MTTLGVEGGRARDVYLVHFIILFGTPVIKYIYHGIATCVCAYIHYHNRTKN
jgi:hypothetical protein